MEQNASTSHIFSRNSRVELPMAVKGMGCYLIDDNGRKYLDASSGAAVSCLGHDHPVIRKAIKTQLDTLPYAHSSFFTSEPAETLADLLVQHSPDGLERVHFVSSGSEAVEAAIKLARQYYVEKGEKNRQNIITRRQSYHGNTLGALSVGTNKWRREFFEPHIFPCTHISPCYEYRYQNAGETAFDYGQRVANELEDAIIALGPDTVMAFIAEPIVGATAGALTAAPGYFKRIREICDKYQILLILDEVMCGMGRAGTFFACEHDNITPDIVCIAKGLGAGYLPLAAILCTLNIYQSVKQGSGSFRSAHTYNQHPLACAVGQAVVHSLIHKKILQQISPKGKQLREKLQETIGNHRHCGNIRGRGLLWGIELVRDRITKNTFEPTEKIHWQIKQAAQQEGLLCYTQGGTIDGTHGDHILIAPPYIIDEEQIAELGEKLKKTFKTVWR